MKTNSPPLALRRARAVDELLSSNWYNSIHFLGSFRPSAYDAQSQIVKHFKEPTESTLILQPTLAHAYAKLVAEIARPENPDTIVRVLASSEMKPDPNRPLSLLTVQLSKTLGIPDRTDLFFRSDAREPMRYVEQLSGPDALRKRLNYVSQDIFLRPEQVGQRVLLVDDIYNLGATMRIYAAALKRFCGVEHVIAVNLAATRFRKSKDEHGDLWLDLEQFAAHAKSCLTRTAKKAWAGTDPFQIGWIRDDIFHAVRECPALGPAKARKTLLFLQGKDAKVCAECRENAGWWRKVMRIVGR